MKNITRCLAENLRDLRKQRGLTQEGLAERADISAQSVHYIESQRRWPSAEMIAALAKALKVSEPELFEDISSPKSFHRAWEVVTQKVEKRLLKLKG